MTGVERMAQSVEQSREYADKGYFRQPSKRVRDREAREREEALARLDAFVERARAKPPHLFSPFFAWKEMEALGLDAFAFYVQGMDAEGYWDRNFYLRQGDNGFEIWLPEPLKESPYVVFNLGCDALPHYRKEYALRFGIGAERHTVRVCADRLTGLLHYALPAGDEALKAIIWFRPQTPQEWMEESPQYDYRVLSWNEAKSDPECKAQLKSERWETFHYGETGTVYCRKLKS